MKLSTNLGFLLKLSCLFIASILDSLPPLTISDFKKPEVYAQKETCSEELNVERSVSRCLQVFVFRFVLSCGKDSTMKLWEVGTERLVKQYVGVVHTQLRFLADTRALKRKTWEQLASEEGKDIPKASEIERLMCRTGVDHVLNRVS
ncbi:uncharacterized protein LOC131642127 [Vicia villosa]|uniref:uncharacterized protein LOC131642127 n=1 Tax=Vicia villosa TaxID=3911 RepID=UPI00273B2766|nr:uncharacterized protein LOC131642127 [Vicia villosa]